MALMVFFPAWLTPTNLFSRNQGRNHLRHNKNSDRPLKFADRSSSRSEGNHARMKGKASQSETARLQGSAAGSLGPQEDWEQLNEAAERSAAARMEATRAQAAGAKEHSNHAALNMDMED